MGEGGGREEDDGEEGGGLSWPREMAFSFPRVYVRFK